MILIENENIDAALKKFGYNSSSDVLPDLRQPSKGSVRFTVPLSSLRQAAISEVVIDAIVADGVEGDALVWLTDWSIYYQYELRLFWKNLGYDIVGGELPKCVGAYWPRTEKVDADRIKSAFFIMMAFEFSGFILFKNAGAKICVDDGTAIITAKDERLRKEVEQVTQQEPTRR